MDDIRVDRLTLKLSGLGESRGRDLAMLITQGLAAAAIEHDGTAATPPAIKVDLTASTLGSLGLLSERVVAEILRQLERSP
jgi:hypothetical protein